MKLLLLQPPNNHEKMTGLYPKGYAKKARSTFPPLGLLTLAAHLKTKHDVAVIDMILEEKTAHDLENIINEHNPDVIGITVVIGLWASVLRLIDTIKKIDPTITTVVGGPNVTYYPAETYSHKQIDYIIVGNGQKPLMSLCDNIESNLSCDDIVNCYGRNKTHTKFPCVHTEEYYIQNYPHADRTFTDLTKYNVPFCPDNPATTMITSMGCPFKCSFCTTARPPVQIYSVDNIVTEMREIESLGIKSVLFQDELFTINKNRAKQVCEALINENIKLHWTMKSRIDTIKDWMPAMMKESGCFNIHFGIESGNDKTLKRMRKGYTKDDIFKTVKMVKDSGLSCTGNFMLAYPGETKQDIENSIKFAQELDLDVSQFSITIDSPGSRLFDEALSCGRRDKDYLSDFIAHPDPENCNLPTELFSASENFSDEELKGFLEKAYASTRTLFDIE